MGNHSIINGKLVSTENALISVQDRGFRYGDGVFETIRIVGGAPWRLDWHLQRLENGLRVIKIAFNIDELRPHIHLLLEKNAMQDGLLRLQVTRGNGGRGYLPDANMQANVVIETMPLPTPPQEPVSLWLSGYQKISAAALPVQFKLCQGLNSTLARMEANEHQCFDALMLNEKNEICETSSANVFWEKDGTLYTPALGCGVLEGSTRAAIMQQFPITETAATLETLSHADAVCITNVAWGVLPVARLLPDDMRWKSKPMALHLNQALHNGH